MGTVESAVELVSLVTVGRQADVKMTTNSVKISQPIAFGNFDLTTRSGSLENMSSTRFSIHLG